MTEKDATRLARIAEQLTPPITSEEVVFFSAFCGTMDGMLLSELADSMDRPFHELQSSEKDYFVYGASFAQLKIVKENIEIEVILEEDDEDKTYH